MGRPRSIHERSSRCSLLAAPASMTARLYRSSRAQCLAFTVAPFDFGLNVGSCLLDSIYVSMA